MAWSISHAMMRDFENSRCSQEQEVEYLVENCLDGEPSAQLSTTPMPDQYYWPDKTTEHSHLSRFGMTCVHLMGGRGEELLTWYLEGFRVKTFHQQAQEKESTEENQVCGKNKNVSFASLILGSHTWKTPQGSLLGGSMLFSQTWPKWGSMRNGACYLREKPDLHMNVTESGYWLPTPTAHNAKEGNYPAERTRNTPTLAAVLGGKINPEFTEWMMGWPIGHTGLKPLAMDKFQSWLQQHSMSL